MRRHPMIVADQLAVGERFVQPPESRKRIGAQMRAKRCQPTRPIQFIRSIENRKRLNMIAQPSISLTAGAVSYVRWIKFE